MLHEVWGVRIRLGNDPVGDMKNISEVFGEVLS